MNTQIMPVSVDCRHLGFDRKGLNPVGFVSLFAHFYELDKEEKNSFYVQSWRRLQSDHLHMTSLEVKGQVLSPAEATPGPGNVRGVICRQTVHWKLGHGHGCLAGCLVHGLPSPHP